MKDEIEIDADDEKNVEFITKKSFIFI